MAGETPWWLTVLLALLGPAGLVAGHLLSERQDTRRDRRERNARNTESRKHLYAQFLQAGRAMAPAIAEGRGQAALANLRATAADAQFSAPDSTDAVMAATVDAAQRLINLAAANAPTSVAVSQAAGSFEERLSVARAVMRADTGLD